MTEAQIAIASLIVGAALSGIISLYFYRKSVSKRLSAYIQFASPVLSGVDDTEVRKALEIHYRGTKIEDLLQLQFVIANEGQRAIRDLIEPLSVTLPKNAKLLEARILHVEPTGREVNIGPVELLDGRTKVEIRFKLLNKREFFIVKMLINGSLDIDKLRFNIVVDDLPPIITPERQPFGTAEEEPTTGIGAVLLGLLLLALGTATVFGVMELKWARPELFPGGQRFAWFSWVTLAILLWLAGAGYWLGRGVYLVIGRGLLGRKHRFRLPHPAKTVHDPRFYGGMEPEELYYFQRRLRHLSEADRDRLIHDMRRPRASSERQDDF
ncbi:MAG: hypothetical protein ABSA59_07925 [Terriglobia bacterium]|jgi:hypothetical protein